MKLSSLFLTAALALAFTACDSTDPDDGGTLEVQTASNVPADLAQRDDQGNVEQTGQYTLFDLESGQVALSYADTDRSDSLSASWDIGFQSTNVIVNTTEGSEAGAQMLETLFEDVTEAPASGYASALADAWFNYDPQTHIVTPVPGRVIVVRTAEGNHAKIRIVSYYEDAPAEPTGAEPPRYYTFEYVVQTDGTRDFPVE